MRKIKFRVWNGKKNKWVHGPNDEVNLFGETILLGAFMDGVNIQELNDCIACQFTGLLDKNNKEIYEGDILVESEHNPYSTSERSIVVVEYCGGCFCYRDTHTKKVDSLHSVLGFVEKDEEAEVIGNIFDNPDLLK